MSDRYRCCGARKAWSRNSHLDTCRFAPKRSRQAHPSTPKAVVECPAHPGEGLIDCRPCETLSEERRENV